MSEWAWELAEGRLVLIYWHIWRDIYISSNVSVIFIYLQRYCSSVHSVGVPRFCEEEEHEVNEWQLRKKVVFPSKYNYNGVLFLFVSMLIVYQKSDKSQTCREQSCMYSVFLFCFCLFVFRCRAWAPSYQSKSEIVSLYSKYACTCTLTLSLPRNLYRQLVLFRSIKF